MRVICRGTRFQYCGRQTLVVLFIRVQSLNVSLGDRGMRIVATFQVNPPEQFTFKPEEWEKWSRRFERFRIRDSKMRVLAQTTTFWPLLSRANAVDEN